MVQASQWCLAAQVSFLEALGVGYFFLMTMDLSPTPQSSICPDAEKAAKCVWIPFGDHPLKLERYRED